MATLDPFYEGLLRKWSLLGQPAPVQLAQIAEAGAAVQPASRRAQPFSRILNDCASKTVVQGLKQRFKTDRTEWRLVPRTSGASVSSILDEVAGLVLACFNERVTVAERQFRASEYEQQVSMAQIMDKVNQRYGIWRADQEIRIRQQRQDAEAKAEARRQARPVKARRNDPIVDESNVDAVGQAALSPASAASGSAPLAEAESTEEEDAADAADKVDEAELSDYEFNAREEAKYNKCQEVVDGCMPNYAALPRSKFDALQGTFKQSLFQTQVRDIQDCVKTRSRQRCQQDAVYQAIPRRLLQNAATWARENEEARLGEGYEAFAEDDQGGAAEQREALAELEEYVLPTANDIGKKLFTVRGVDTPGSREAFIRAYNRAYRKLVEENGEGDFNQSDPSLPDDRPAAEIRRLALLVLDASNVELTEAEALAEATQRDRLHGSLYAEQVARPSRPAAARKRAKPGGPGGPGWPGGLGGRGSRAAASSEPQVVQFDYLQLVVQHDDRYPKGKYTSWPALADLDYTGGEEKELPSPIARLGNLWYARYYDAVNEITDDPRLAARLGLTFDLRDRAGRLTEAQLLDFVVRAELIAGASGDPGREAIKTYLNTAKRSQSSQPSQSFQQVEAE